MYVYHIRGSYKIIKNNHSYGVFKSEELADSISDELIKIDWNLDKFPDIFEFNNEFYITYIKNNKIYIVSQYSSKDEASSNYDEDVERFVDNPNNSKFGAFIYPNNYKSFSIFKSINGINTNFGSFRSLYDAKFVRNTLMDIDWNIDNLEDIYYNEFSDTYDVVGVYKNKIKILESFDSIEDAQNNLQDVLDRFEYKKMVFDEDYIQENGNQFAIHDSDSKYFGSFKSFEDACTVRDFLVENNWDLTNFDYNSIYHINGYYWRFVKFKSYLRIVGKYENFDDAFLNQNNISDYSLKDLTNPDNQYLEINRNIIKRKGKFEVTKRIDGQKISFGIFDTRQEAIKARDEFESNGWEIDYDENSIFNDSYQDSFQEIVFNLTLWQKLIYDAIDKMDCDIFYFDDLINHNTLRPYKRGNFNSKVEKYLNELIDLNLVRKIGDGSFRALWKN